MRKKSAATETETETELTFTIVHEASYRVYRGGGCYLSAQLARVAYRYDSGPTFRYGSLGFRLVRDEAG